MPTPSYFNYISAKSTLTVLTISNSKCQGTYLVNNQKHKFQDKIQDFFRATEAKLAVVSAGNTACYLAAQAGKQIFRFFLLKAIDTVNEAVYHAYQQLVDTLNLIFAGIYY